MSRESHPLFEAYPLDGEREISAGPVPTPYHIYNGQGLLVGGTADSATVGELLGAERVYPTKTRGGRALMGIWVVDFTEASLGPHKELQVSILASHQPVAPVQDHPLALLKDLFVNPEARMFCYRLWNDSPTAVAYNRELLGLPAALAEGMLQRAGGRLLFHFEDEAGELILEGEVQAAARTSFQAAWSLFRLFGLRQTLRAFSQPYLEAKVVNPVTAALPYNTDAQTLLAADSPAVRFFDPTSEHVTFGDEHLNVFDFRPQFVEHFSPFRFVYLQPESEREEQNV